MCIVLKKGGGTEKTSFQSKICQVPLRKTVLNTNPGDDPPTCFTKWHTAMDLVECHHTANAELEEYRANRRGGEEEQKEEGINEESIEEQKDEEDIY